MMSYEHLGAPVALTTGSVAFLPREGVEVGAAAGEVLVRRGEPGVAFWAILEGLVDVRLFGSIFLDYPCC